MEEVKKTYNIDEKNIIAFMDKHRETMIVPKFFTSFVFFTKSEAEYYY